MRVPASAPNPNPSPNSSPDPSPKSNQGSDIDFLCVLLPLGADGKPDEDAQVRGGSRTRPKG